MSISSNFPNYIALTTFSEKEEKHLPSPNSSLRFPISQEMGRKIDDIYLNTEAHYAEFRDRLDQIQLTLSQDSQNSPKTILVSLNSRHPEFVGRNAFFPQLAQMISTPWTVLASSPVRVLHGPGGIGKTELAIAFANDNSNKFSLIAFLNCETQEQYEKSLRDLAKALKLPIEKKSPSEIQAQVTQKLEQGIGLKPYLLIFDNADLLPTLPTRGGYILLTTRYPDIYPYPNTHIRIPPLTLKETTLLAKTIQKKTLFFESHVEALHQKTEGSSVLLNLAFHYLEDTACPFNEYLSLLEQGSRLEDRTERYPRSLNQIVLSSRKHLSERNPLAAEFLNLCAYLTPSNISLEYLKNWLKLQQDPLMLETEHKIIKDLKTSSLIEYHQQQKNFTLHRMTQTVLQRNLGKEGFKKTCTFTTHFCKSYDEDVPKSWPRGEFAALQIDIWKTAPYWEEAESLDRAELLHITGDWLRKVKGVPRAALSCHQEALKVHEQMQDQPGIVKSYHYIGSSQRMLGQSEEALASHKKALDIRLSCDSPTALKVAMCYVKIGASQERLGQSEEAIAFNQIALETYLHCQRTVSVATCHGNIGVSQNNLGRSEEALVSHKKALDILLKRYGPKHPKVATCYKNIGKSCSDLKNYRNALYYYQKALQIRQEYFGERDSRTISCQKAVEQCAKKLECCVIL